MPVNSTKTRSAALERARFERTIAVNLTAPVFLAQAFAAQAPDGADASIVNIVDQRVLKPTPRFFSYTLSKSALASATVTLAQALAPNVRVNAVAPGPTLPSPRQTDEQFARQAAAVPLKRGPSPEDIAAAVLYLAQAKSVTGTVIAVDGGQHLAWRTARQRRRRVARKLTHGHLDYVLRTGREKGEYVSGRRTTKNDRRPGEAL